MLSANPRFRETGTWGRISLFRLLEMRILPELCEQGKPVFVDTNISLETLKKIAKQGHVLVMLADPEISVHRFFSSIMSQNYPSHFKTILISVAPIFELISSSPFGTKPHFS